MRSVFEAVLGAGFGLILSTGVALAQAQALGPNDPGIQQRMDHQENRIEQGVQSGALTPRETGRLEGEQAHIQQAKERMKSDGQLTVPSTNDLTLCKTSRRGYLPAEA